MFTILLGQQLKHCKCSSAEWTSNNLWTSMALNVQHVPVRQHGSKLEDGGPPPHPQRKKTFFYDDDNDNSNGINQLW